MYASIQVGYASFRLVMHAVETVDEEDFIIVEGEDAGGVMATATLDCGCGWSVRGKVRGNARTETSQVRVTSECEVSPRYEALMIHSK
jgi:hypothetical protein